MSVNSIMEEKRALSDGELAAKSGSETRGLTPGLVATICLLSSIAPFSTDLFLSGFPRMVKSLGTTPAGIQLCLTSFLMGAGLGQLAFGPLSDRYGRLKPVIAGSIMCVLSSAAAAMSPNIQFLIIARAVQGLSASAGMVIGRAIISDIAKDRTEAARAFNIIMPVMGIAPIAAPWLGSMLIDLIGWRGELWMVSGITALSMISVFAFLRDTRPQAHRSNVLSGWDRVRILLNRRFIGNTMAFGFSFAAMMGYISASPFLYQVAMGFSARRYGMTFAGMAMLMSVCSIVSARLMGRVSPRRLLRCGLTGLALGSLTLMTLVLARCSPIGYLAGIVLAVGSMGFIMGNATSGAITAAKGASGTGSAAMGALQFGLGASAAPLVGLGGDSNVFPLALVMTLSVTIAIVGYFIAESGER